MAKMMNTCMKMATHTSSSLLTMIMICPYSEKTLVGGNRRSLNLNINTGANHLAQASAITKLLCACDGKWAQNICK